MITMLPTTLHIDITQHDIDHGIGRDCTRCPAARAAIRTMLDQWETVVTTNVGGNEVAVFVHNADGWMTDAASYYDPSGELAMFIYGYDNHESPAPQKIALVRDDVGYAYPVKLVINS